MIISIDVNSWKPQRVEGWLSGLCDNPSWMKGDYIMNNNFDGRQLLIATAKDLHNIGATKVDLQEHILEAIERLRFYNFNITKETLQAATLRLACQSRALQRQLVPKRTKSSNDIVSTNCKVITLTRDFSERDNTSGGQRVDLDTLAFVSAIVKTVREITEILNRAPFSRYDDYRSMKSLILALSIELTSTAQRDQFVERPNDILEKSSKALADYCDRIVHGTKDMLLIQPFHLSTVRIRKGPNETELGLVIRSQTNGVHLIDKITPLSPAKKTNQLHEGDEIIFFNRFITGWSAKNVQTLLESSAQMSDITLIVKKNPSE